MGSNPIPRTTTLLLLKRNLNETEWIKIIILKNYKEVEYLLSKGVNWGEDGIETTHSRHSGKTYRLCESKRNLELIKNYRNGIIAK